MKENWWCELMPVRMFKETEMKIKIIRSNYINYSIYCDSVLSYEIEDKGRFWTEIFSIYTPGKELLAAFKNRRYLFFNKRSLHLVESNQNVDIEYRKTGFRFVLNYACYELRYGLFNFNGFYYNEELVATLSVIDQSLGVYEKEVTVLKEVPCFYLFILFYVAIDCFDVN